MPWVPELFTAPALEQLQEMRRSERLLDVPFFDGLLVGDLEALVASFVDEPELHDPVRGRIRGERAFGAFVAEMRAWLKAHNGTVEDVERIVLDARGFEEVVVHVDGAGGRPAVRFAIVADHRADGRLYELRLYYGNLWMTGVADRRAPLLQHDPELLAPAAVASYLGALAAGDVEAVVATFEPDGTLHEPGADAVHQGREALRAHYTAWCADGGVAQEACAVVDDGHTCALEYNIVGRGRVDVAPQAGVAVFVRGAAGRLAQVRVYDDGIPPARRSQPWKDE